TRPRVWLTAVLAVVVLAVARPSAAAPPPLADDYRFWPPDSDILFVAHLDKLIASDPVKKLRKDIPEFDKGIEGFRIEFGVPITEVERMAASGRMKGTGLTVLHVKKAVKAADVVAAHKEPRFEGDKGRTYKEEKVGKLTLY